MVLFGQSRPSCHFVVCSQLIDQEIEKCLTKRLLKTQKMEFKSDFHLESKDFNGNKVSETSIGGVKTDSKKQGSLKKIETIEADDPEHVQELLKKLETLEFELQAMKSLVRI